MGYQYPYREEPKRTIPWGLFVFAFAVLFLLTPLYFIHFSHHDIKPDRKAPSVTVPRPTVASHPQPAKPVYKSTPTPPYTGALQGFSVVMDYCYRRDIRRIICIGQMTNTTDAPTTILLGDTNVVDSEGNSFMINGTFGGAGGLGFGGAPNFQDPGRSDGGGSQDIMPGVATTFHAVIPDDHQNVGSISIMLALSTESSAWHMLTFPHISVQ